MGGSKFKFVYIPADTSEPLQQWEQELIPGKEVECLIDRLKAHFASTGPRKTAEQVRAQQAELMSKLPAGSNIDSKVLDVATSLNMVENISLLSNARDNGFVGVNLYADDEGAIRGLPRNMRASEIAHCCGKPLEVKGDAFLARVLDDGDRFERLDFDLSEVSSAAAWVQQARRQAEARRAAESGEELLARLRSERGGGGGGVAAGGAGGGQVRELTPAEAAKDEGNKAFKRGDWAAAVEHYSRAVELEAGMVAALNNRAMAHLKLQQWAQAEADCGAVLAAEPRNVKALLRRATAAAATGRGEAAAADWRAVLELEPRNREAAAALAELGDAAGAEASAEQQQQQQSKVA